LPAIPPCHFPLERCCYATPLTLPSPKRKVCRARYTGFGSIDSPRSCVHDLVSPFLIVHFIWLFLSPLERDHLTSLHPALRSYVCLCLTASSIDVQPLTCPRPPEPPDAPTDAHRVTMMAAALLRFNFNYGDLFRWLQGPYTHAHRQWTTLSNLFDTVKQARSPKGWPNI